MMCNNAQDFPPVDNAVTRVLATDATANSSSGSTNMNVQSTTRLPDKVMCVLLDELAPDAIWWVQQGTAFAVNKDKFQVQILDKYFRGNKFKSFVRNLHLWGFKRTTYEDKSLGKTVAFSHKFFVRDNPELVKMVEKGSGGRRDSEKKGPTKLAAASAKNKRSNSSPMQSPVLSGAPVPSVETGGTEGLGAWKQLECQRLMQGNQLFETQLLAQAQQQALLSPNSRLMQASPGSIRFGGRNEGTLLTQSLAAANHVLEGALANSPWQLRQNSLLQGHERTASDYSRFHTDPSALQLATIEEQRKRLALTSRQTAGSRSTEGPHSPGSVPWDGNPDWPRFGGL